MNNLNSAKTSLALAICLSIQSAGVGAQGLLEEVIVTAQKRAESVQDVPISITATSGDFIASVGAQSVDDLGIYTPGLETRVTQATQPAFAIRGITTNDFGIDSDPAVAVYVDGVYSGRSGASMTAFQDIERVEVLKGPQGTLFGKNAAAGAIHLVSKKPEDEFSARVKVGLGNFSQRVVEGMLNVPLNEDVALRINVLDNQNDGYIRNEFDGNKLADDNNSGATAMLSWQLSEDTDLLFKIEYANVDQSAAVDISTLEGRDVYNNTVSLDFNPVETLELWGTSLTVNSVFDDYSLTSVSAFKSFESSNLRDQDGSSFFVHGQGGLLFNTGNREENEFFSQELRLNYEGSDTLRWTAGLMYSNEDGMQDSLASFSTDIISTATGGALPLPNGFEFAELARGDLKSTSAAIYADMNYSLNDAMNLTLGVRYTRDEKEYELTVPGATIAGQPLLIPGLGPIGIVFSDILQAHAQEKTWNNFSYRAVVDYHFNESSMVYASVATGYKSGGFNSTQLAQPVNEETVTNFELGIKSEAFDSRLRVNAALYAYEYEDLQEYSTITNEAGLPILVIRNQDAEGQGFEFDAVFALNDQFSLNANYNYIETEISKYPLFSSEDPASSREGQSLPNIADHTFNFGVQYDLSLAEAGSVSARIDYSYVGDRKSTLNTDSVPFLEPLLNLHRQDYEGSYNNVSARVTYLNAEEDWKVSVWARNLTDEEYLENIDQSSFNVGAAAVIRNQPRSFGVEVNYFLN